jgi:hypothetical protein
MCQTHFAEGAVHWQVLYLYSFFCNQSDLLLFMLILSNISLHQLLSHICIPSYKCKLMNAVQVQCDFLNCRPASHHTSTLQARHHTGTLQARHHTSTLLALYILSEYVML